MLVILLMLPLVFARPSCVTISNLQYVDHNYTHRSFDMSAVSRVFPDPFVAYSGQTLKQSLYIADTSNTTVYPVTPPAVNGKPGIYNLTILPVGDGFLVQTYMYKDQPSDTYCQEPFGVAFGTTFEYDRIAIVTIVPGYKGSWSAVQKQTTTNVNILVCSNATLCAYPAFNRWGPAGTIYTTNDFVVYGDSCFINNTFTISINTSRLNLGFRFNDGNLYLYHSKWLPMQGLNLMVDYPLHFLMSVGVGANLPNMQFYQAVVRQGTPPVTGADKNDANCLAFQNNLYLAYISKRDLLVSYDDNGLPIAVADCSQNAGDELYCVTGTFSPQVGVYPLSRYRALVSDYVQISQQGSICSLPYSDILKPPQPIVWKRHTVTNCSFDFDAIVNRLPTFQLKCFGVSPAKLAQMCYSSVTLDIFRANTTHLANMLGKVPDVFSKYNYALPPDFYGCVHSYYINDSSRMYAIAQQWPATVIAPGGRQPYNSYVGTVLNTPNPTCTQLTCFGVVVISLKPASGKHLVCPSANDTDLVTRECVKYNLYGYTGTGVFNESSLVIPDSKLFVASSTGDIIAAKVRGKVYSITPCVSVPISVGYDPSFERALLFNGLSCSERSVAVSLPASDYWLAAVADNASTGVVTFDTLSGCVHNVRNATDITVPTCLMPLGNSLCLANITQPSQYGLSTTSSVNLLSLVTYDPTFQGGVKVMSPVYWISIPTNFTLGAITEYIQTTSPKVNVDCVKYLCGDSERCTTVLLQYGTFCDDVNKALSEVSSIIDASMISLVSEITADVVRSENALFDTTYNFTGLLGCVGSNCNDRTTYRSALSDLLYNKVKVTDPGFMSSYQKCISQWGGDIRDLFCTQNFNGISVLPPIVSPGMQALYTSLLVGAVASAGYTFGVTSVGVIPFATQLQFRLNGLGVTTQVLVENQQLIANSFNKALVSIQQGFDATNEALSKMQSVINQHAQQLQTLVSQLGNSFGAISSSINEIFSRLDGLEANAQVDRLINGRMVVLNTYVTQLLIKASEVKSQALLAKQKISECVKSQSLRNDFCGNGTHVFSVPQLAPNGIMFLHYTYKPTSYALVQTAAGLCLNNTGYAPRDGLFVLPNGSIYWQFTKMNFYNPVRLTNSNTQVLTTCSVNYTTVNYTVLPPTDNMDFNFTAEFEKWYKNHSSQFNNTFNPGDFNFSTVDIQNELNTLNAVVKQLNESFIDLKKLNVYEQTIKWPWYIWLAMIAGLVGLALAVVMLLCMTNCCSCFKGMCACKPCHYDEVEDVYPAVRVYNKRTA
ncbi:spike glycoprotein [Bat coronavirus HKU9-5-2]|uniref:Spike glycoprotein n=1 Tax=Bat coronavirus HKU9-5-2 TaxID=875615 RepID=E0ZN44_BCHK9|nr:spike glycoprotein [Bat coronavirus HKU9-5-2]